MIDEAELRRVVAIHSALDEAAREGAGAFRMCDRNGAELSFTDDEVASWPKWKAAMESKLRQYGGYYAINYGLEVGPDAFSRGLVMYRQMIEYPKEDKHTVTFDPAFKLLLEELPNAMVSYTGSDVVADQVRRLATDRADTTRGKANEPTRRERLVAALAAEMRRPVERRFPHPGRNFELKDFKS